MRFYRAVIFTALAVYWVALFVGTHVPGKVMRAVPANDKFLHFTGHAGLGVLLTLATALGGLTRVKLLGLVVILVVYAAFDELTQQLVPGRICDFWDWCADVSGGVVGIAVTAGLVHWWRGRDP